MNGEKRNGGILCPLLAHPVCSGHISVNGGLGAWRHTWYGMDCAWNEMTSACGRDIDGGYKRRPAGTGRVDRLAGRPAGLESINQCRMIDDTQRTS